MEQNVSWDIVDCFLKVQRVMHLAVARDGVPWCAAVYFVHHLSNFYFFSSARARHVPTTPAGINATAAISYDAATWQEIRGVQLAGWIIPVRSSQERVAAITRYLAKFPFARRVLQSKSSRRYFFSKRSGLPRLYKFQATEIYYLDNHFGLGHRQCVLPVSAASKNKDKNTGGHS